MDPEFHLSALHWKVPGLNPMKSPVNFGDSKCCAGAVLNLWFKNSCQVGRFRKFWDSRSRLLQIGDWLNCHQEGRINWICIGKLLIHANPIWSTSAREEYPVIRVIVLKGINSFACYLGNLILAKFILTKVFDRQQSFDV